MPSLTLDQGADGDLFDHLLGCHRHGLRPREAERFRCSRDGRLPCSKRDVSILQLWCSLNVCMSIVDLHRTNFWDHGGQHGQESEEGKEGKEDSQEEKEVAVRRKLHSIRITSEGRYALRSTDRRQLPPTEYPRNKQ